MGLPSYHRYRCCQFLLMRDNSIAIRVNATDICESLEMKSRELDGIYNEERQGIHRGGTDRRRFGSEEARIGKGVKMWGDVEWSSWDGYGGVDELCLFWNVTARVTAAEDTPFFRSAANEHATSGSSLTGDSIHAVTSVLRHHKRTRKDVRPMLAQFENLPLKRTRGSTGTGGVLRVWDVLLFQGNRVMLFRTALALMELYGPALVTTKDVRDTVTLL
ncbi:Rab-GTPase-TBC domain-containing protein [Tanacetum coccineum]